MTCEAWREEREDNSLESIVASWGFIFTTAQRIQGPTDFNSKETLSFSLEKIWSFCQLFSINADPPSTTKFGRKLWTDIVELGNLSFKIDQLFWDEILYWKKKKKYI